MSWVLMLIFAVLCMFAASRATKGKFVLIRVGGVGFLAAGVLLADSTGWVADMFRGILGWLIGTTDNISNALFSTPIAWMIAAGLMILWILGMLPDNTFQWDPPDSLILAGTALPIALSLVPGAIGDVLRVIVDGLSTALTGGVGGAI